MQENKMGVMPVGKLLVTMSIPMMASQLVQALYNIVDSIFVSRINENALTAVSLAFPMQMLLIAFAMGAAVGMNALLSKALGEGDEKRANDVAQNALIIAAASYFIFLIIGLFLTEPFLRFQLAEGNDYQIVEYGVQYLSIVCIFSFGIFTQVMFERMFQSTGRTIYAMITQCTGAVINMILDPIFIFTLEMGVAGAAIATVIGQIVAAILAVFLSQKKNKEIHLNFRHIRPDMGTIKNILAVGFPTTVMQAIGSVMSYCMNMILSAFTSTATAVFGAYFKIQSFVFMPVFGLNNGMVPIIAYNYGAQKRSRMLKTIKLSIIVAECLTIAGFIVFQIIPGPLLSIFKASEHMLKIGRPALRTISVSFLASGGCIVIGSVFQALGNGVYSLIVSFARQLVVLLPVAFLFSKIGKLALVWWAFPIAEVMSLAVSLFLLFRINRKVISKVADNV